MKKAWAGFAVVFAALWPSAEATPGSPPAPAERHRSPADLAILPDGRRALTANHTADSVSLVDLANAKVLAEQPCGHKPVAVACSRDGRRAAVSNLWAGTLTLLEVRDAVVRTVAEVVVGRQPRGVVFAPDGASIYVALAGAGEVAQIDWLTGRVLRRWPGAGEPRRLALTRDGRLLAAACGRAAVVRCWDTQTGRPVWERAVDNAFNLHGLALSPDETQLVLAHSHDRYRAIAASNIEQGWALDSRLTRLALRPRKDAGFWQIALDVRHKAIGDPCAAAFSAAGEWLAVTAAGTHELLLFRPAAVPWNSGDPGDFLDSILDQDDGKYRRVLLGGRPLAVQFTRDQAVVANYLLDAVQVVDARSGKLVRQIALGGPATPSLARRGEAIFYDAGRSLHQWFSCHTCHPDGHTCGRTFDTLNDDSYGNTKLTPSLRGVAKTGPWTWHGWQDDLGKAVEKSLTETLFGPPPSADDVKAVVAFLETLDHPPNVHRGPAVERGRALFDGKARCARCHQGTEYTSPRNYDVKLGDDGSPFERWNPPSLRGLSDRGPYLHDGRAETLEELLRSPHAPEKLGGAALTPEERRDLIEFLKSL